MKKFLHIFFVFGIFSAAALSAYGESSAASKPKGISAGVRTMLRSISNHPSSIVRTKADTTHPAESKIRSIFNNKNSSDNWTVVIDLTRDYEKVEIAAYNILGRKVLDIAPRENYKQGQITKEFDTYSLPEGMYILVVQGQDLRLAEKFIVSR